MTSFLSKDFVCGKCEHWKRGKMCGPSQGLCLVKQERFHLLNLMITDQDEVCSE
jgi:hypothetical protein